MGCGASVEPAEVDPDAERREELRRLRAEIEEMEEKVKKLKKKVKSREFEQVYLEHTIKCLGSRSSFTGRQLAKVADERQALLDHLMERDALGVEAASAGWGTDEAAMADIIMRRTDWQLQGVNAYFQKTFNKSMAARVSSENRTFLGNITGAMTPFGQLLIYRLQTTEERIASVIRKSVTGLGADDDALVEALSVCTNDELKGAAEAYARMYEEDMAERIRSETSGMFSKNYAKWMSELAEFNRSEGGDEDGAEQAAQDLYDAGAGRMMGTNAEVYIDHLAKASPAKCEAVILAYEALEDTSNTLREDVERKFRGDLETAILARLSPRLELLARNLHAATKGFGSDKKAIARIFGGLRLKDTADFRDTFERLFAEDLGENALEQLLDAETGGDLRDALRRMFASPSPTGNNRDPGENEVMAKDAADAFKEALAKSYEWEEAADKGRAIDEDKPAPDVAVNPTHWHGAPFPEVPYVTKYGYD